MSARELRRPDSDPLSLRIKHPATSTCLAMAISSASAARRAFIFELIEWLTILDEQTSLIAHEQSLLSLVWCSDKAVDHRCIGASTVNSCFLVRPFSSMTAHRWSGTGYRSIFPLLIRPLTEIENQTLYEHSRHAVRTARVGHSSPVVGEVPTPELLIILVDRVARRRDTRRRAHWQ